MSCQPFTQIPTPPTTLSSCAVPIGGSNSSILDACCNGHINAIITYDAPDADSNSEDNDGCFQYCVPDSAEDVKRCLTEKMAEYEQGQPMFQCFNVGNVKKSQGPRYSSAGVKNGSVGWTMRVVFVVGFVSMAMSFA